MSQKRGRDRAPARPQRGPRNARPLRWVLLAGAVAALAGLAWNGARSPRRDARGPLDPAHALAAPEAYREAIRLANANRPAESLPYFRRAFEGLNQDSWEVHFNYGLTLAANAILYTPRVGEPRLAARSSVVRVGLVHEAMHQMDRASRLAPNPRARAQVLGRFANLLSVWGFPWETLDLLRRTEYADTTNLEAVARAMLYLKMMRDPPLYTGDLTVEQALGVPAAAGRPRR